MNGRPRDTDPNLPEDRANGGLVLQPISDMSEYESKPKPEQPVTESEPHEPLVEPEINNANYLQHQDYTPIDHRRVAARVPLLKAYLLFPIVAALILAVLSYADDTSIASWFAHIPESISDQVMFIYRDVIQYPLIALRTYGPLLIGIIPFLYLLGTHNVKGARNAVITLLVIHAAYAVQYVYALVNFYSLPGMLYFSILRAILLSATVLLIILLSLSLRSIRKLPKQIN